MPGEMIALGGLALAVAIALGKIWTALNRKIEVIEERQAAHQVDVIRGFASMGHFDKLEVKLDRLIEKVEKLGLQLASHSRSETLARVRAAEGS